MRALAWVALFAGGLIIGYFMGRGGEPETPVAPAPAPAITVPASGTNSGPDRPAASPYEPAAAAPASSGASVASHPEAPMAPAVPTPTAARSPFEPAIDSGVVTSVDAGEVFNKQIARPSTPDQPNQLGDAHRALEREPRDDSWAYSMEAELANSMVNETSMGKFKMEHVECRSTICEVRVSGTGDQADDVRAWTEALRKNPVNQQLFMNVSSAVSSHERIDAIYIFRRPAKNP